MRTIGTIETGKLNEFDNFYQNVDFFNQGDEELYDLITSELSDDVADFIDSEEFWHAEFIFEGKHYLIAADGACTSDGKYVVAKLVVRKMLKKLSVPKNDAGITIETDQRRLYVKSHKCDYSFDIDDLKTIRECADGCHDSWDFHQNLWCEGLVEEDKF